MTEKYLKCKLWTNIPITLFGDEALITICSQNKGINPGLIYKGSEFPPEGEDWTIVSRDDVKLFGTNYGVRLHSLEIDEKKGLALVGVKNCAEARVYDYTVKLEELV